MLSQEDNIPEGWYELNRISYIQPYKNVYVYRTENRGGGLFGLIRYFISIDNISAPVPDSFFIRLSDKYITHYIKEYKYLDEKGQTKYLYSK